MKPNQLFTILDMTIRARRNGDIFNPLFVGPPGVGKTEIVQQWANDRKLKQITLTLSSYDPPDFKGFPVVQVVNGRQRMDFATPVMWPDDGEGVLILEEMNRAPTSIMQCLLSLGDKRRGFDGYTLPPGWIVVGCINPEDGYDTTAMDPALKDRFEQFEVSYDKHSFLNYAKSSEWNKDIINFVEAGMWQFKTPVEIGNIAGAKYISPRTLSKVNTILRAGFEREDELMFLEVELGSNVAKDFYNFRHNESPVMYFDLVNQLEPSLAKLKKFSDPNNYKNGMISLTVKDVIDNGEITDELLLKLCLSIPTEQSTVLIRELEFKRKDETILTRLCSKSKDLKEQFKSVLKFKK